MNVLLLYKGEYANALRGPELRYVSLAQELTALGHKVVIGGRTAQPESLPPAVEFVAVSDWFTLIKAFFTARMVVLHGGGPVILLLAMLVGFAGKLIVLDSYVPHWIELEALSKKQGRFSQIKTLIKSYFNVLRGLFAALVFNGIIAANGRQLDLYRGMIAPFSLTRDFSRFVIIPFGCNPALLNASNHGRHLLTELSNGKISSDDFVIGWLGGTYGWFDLTTLLAKASDAITSNSSIKLVFFGVEAERKRELLACVVPEAQANIIFLPWVNFTQRFNYWSGFDVSLVWGAKGVENDYASRTRNFDCLTLGLPIVQNWDEEWGPRLKESGAGRVTDTEHVAAVLTELSSSPEKIAAMRRAMQQLAPPFYWSRFANQLVAMTQMPAISTVRRVCGLFAFGLILPGVLVLFIYYCLLLFKKN